MEEKNTNIYFIYLAYNFIKNQITFRKFKTYKDNKPWDWTIR